VAAGVGHGMGLVMAGDVAVGWELASRGVAGRIRSGDRGHNAAGSGNRLSVTRNGPLCLLRLHHAVLGTSTG
jgi:hypothetical protein